MVFIKPTILDESGKIYDTTKDRYDTIREIQQEGPTNEPLDLPPYEDLQRGELYDMGRARSPLDEERQEAATAPATRPAL